MKHKSGKSQFETEKNEIKDLASVDIPSSIFKDRSLKVLEILVEYMKDQKNLTYHEIALLLNRDDRTIWTVYNRAQKKRKKEERNKEKDFGDENKKIAFGDENKKIAFGDENKKIAFGDGNNEIDE